MSENISVIGSGSWGVALAMLLFSNGHNVKLWSYNKDEADMINNENKCKFLPNVSVPDGLKCYTDLKDALEDTKIVLMVTPSNAIRTTLNNMKPFIKDEQIFVMCSKGMETTITVCLLSNSLSVGSSPTPRANYYSRGDSKHLSPIHTRVAQ